MTQNYHIFMKNSEAMRAYLSVISPLIIATMVRSSFQKSFYNPGIFLQKKENIRILEKILFWILNIIWL